MSYKYTYFDGRGRAEVGRLCFAAAGQKFEDKRISFEDWGALKAKTPLGSLPILEVDGEVLPQSFAIVRFLARRFKLLGSNDIEEGKINVVLDCLLDLREAVIGTAFEKDEAKK